jgi:beta-lactam-binding protein with PASTA domain
MIKNLIAFLKSHIFLINLGIAIVALPLLFWIIFAWMSSYTRHSDFVTVPDFKDLKTRQLDEFVKDKKIEFEIIDSLWDPKLQKGVVIRQDPDPGSKVKEGRKIYLYVTATVPPTVGMPKLEDLSMRQAMAVCESYGLKAQFTPVDDPCSGCIVKQNYKGKRIEPGTMILKGETVQLLYGKGEDESEKAGFPVPNLVGMSFRSARGKMTDLGLEWVLIADPGVKDTLSATVYSQDPSPGRDRKLIPGAMIDLRVTNDKSKVDSANSKNP